MTPTRQVRKAKTDWNFKVKAPQLRSFLLFKDNFMRNHKLILRQIARDNLDPKIPYVAGKNGKLVPKANKEQEAKKEETVLVEESEVSKITLPQKVNEDFIVPEGAKSIPESLEEDISISKDPVNVKKKSFPSKKKSSKIEVTSE